MGEAGADMSKLADKMDALQTEIEAKNGWELDR
jgi:hypothetical protein